MGKSIIQIIIGLIAAILLFTNIYIYDKIDTTFTLMVLAGFFIANLFINKYKRNKSRDKEDVIFIIVSLTILLVGSSYLIGFKEGFKVNYNTMFQNYIAPITWIKVFLIVFLSEIARSVAIPRDDKFKVRNTIHYIVLLAFYVLIDISISTKTYDLTSLKTLYDFFSLLFIQSISKNILLFYVTKHYGALPSILYRLIMDLYIYLFPVVPNPNILIEAVLLLAFPYIVYLAIIKVTSRKQREPSRTIKKESKLISALTTIIFVLLIGLVSREFEYAMIAVGSSSMTGAVNKGDAVIYERYDKDYDELYVGDILVFERQGVTIIHRITDVYSLYGEKVYQTKGDANQEQDNWVVYEKDVLGVVKQRVPVIAWPSVALYELFN